MNKIVKSYHCQVCGKHTFDAYIKIQKPDIDDFYDMLSYCSETCFYKANK